MKIFTRLVLISMMALSSVYLHASPPGTPATLISPTSPGTLSATNQVFTWTAGSGVSGYELWVGTYGAGSTDIYYSGWTTATTKTVATVPPAGKTVYVQLKSWIGTAWQNENYTFTEPTPSPAQLTSPLSGVLSATNQVFNWSAGTGATAYELLVGTQGVNSSNLYSSGSISTLTATVPSIPSAGATVYVQLGTYIGNSWINENYTFTEPPASPAQLTSPKAGSVLSGANLTFNWNASPGVAGYELWLGNGGVGSNNIYNSGYLTTTTVTIPSQPLNGGVVYAQLKSLISGNWQVENYTFYEPAAYSANVIVYGATPAGITAAVEAAKLGQSVIILEPSQHVGGTMTNGLSNTNQYEPAAVGGLAAQFFADVNTAYSGAAAAKSGYVFEPHVAESVFNTWLSNYSSKITLVDGVSLTSAAVYGTTIENITASNGYTYAGQEYIDASYTGDLMAAAGVSYTVGRESVSQYGEPAAGIGNLLPIADPLSYPSAATGIASYYTPGYANTGLIAHVSAQGSVGAVGQGDTAIEPYNYQLCVTFTKSNQTAFPAPSSYNASEFELLGREFVAYPNTTLDDVFNSATLPNGKYQLNSYLTAQTSDEIGESLLYPSGSASARQQIEAEQTRYILALIKFLQTDPRVPAQIKNGISKLGLCKDEYTDNGNWPHEIDIREARRMIGAYVLTQADLAGTTTVTNSIGLGGFGVYYHPFHVVDNGGQVYYESGPLTSPFQAAYEPPSAYPIAYGAITPQASQITNLLVPVATSSSHVAFSSTRVEITNMILGQAAGAAANLAITGNTTVQTVPYGALSTQLTSDGAVLVP